MAKQNVIVILIKQNILSLMSANFTGLNVCRFCLTETDPKKMIRIAWDEWEKNPLAKLYKIVTSRNVSRTIKMDVHIKEGS